MRKRRSPLDSAVAIAFAMLLTPGCGGSGDGSGGTGGAAGTGGTGGTNGGGIAVAVPQCVSSAYQIVVRALVEPLDPLLRYIDKQPDAGLPDIDGLVEQTDVPGVYARFTWNADDVPGVTDPGETNIQVDFEEGCARSEGTPPDPVECVEFWNLDNGISAGEVALVPWEMTVDGPTVVGKGKMSVIGLDEDTVRVTIVDFNPWYEGWANVCRFEVIGFNLHLDLATEDSEPFAVVIDFRATGNGYAIEAGSVIFGEGDTASFTGQYVLGSAEGIPFDFELDYSTDPAGLQGTLGGIPASCTIDLATFDVTC